MSRFVIATLAMLLFPSFALAQASTEKFQIFAGYSLFHADNGGLSASTLDTSFGASPGTFNVGSNFNGWNVEAQYNANHWLGFVADASGRYGSPVTSSNSGVSGLPTSNGYTFLFGPVFSYRKATKLTPFVHVLAGIDRLHVDSGNVSGLTSSFSTGAVTDSAFAFAFGGGLDYKLSRRISLRAAQLDYVYTGHDLNTFYGDAFGVGTFRTLSTHESNLRFSTGIVFRF